ncbi:MAG: NUDIX domain-containing protein [Candidatus Jorgensenbacteria bacterium]
MERKIFVKSTRPPVTPGREISAGIIIYRRTREGPRFLLLYSGGSYWNFPKGKLGVGEHAFRAALREVEEETGLRPSDLRFKEQFRVRDNFTYVRNRQKIFKTVTYYLAETGEPRVRVKMVPEHHEGERHEGYGWFLHLDAARMLSKPNLRRHLKHAYDLVIRKKSISGGQKHP